MCRIRVRLCKSSVGKKAHQPCHRANSAQKDFQSILSLRLDFQVSLKFSDSAAAAFNRNATPSELEALVRRYGCTIPEKSNGAGVIEQLSPCSSEVAEAVNRKGNPTSHFENHTDRSQIIDIAHLITVYRTTAAGSETAKVIDTKNMTEQEGREFWSLADDMGFGAGSGSSSGSSACSSSGTGPI
jgi:hypothetical protein